MFTRIQTPRVERLEQLDRALPVHELRQLGDGDRSRTESGGVALPRQDGDVRVRRHEVREEAVSFLDAVVVVRNRFARLDDTVLGCRGVRRDAAREPRRVEPHLIDIALPGEGGDVTEGPVAALLRGGRLASRVLREVQAGKYCGRNWSRQPR